MSSARHTIDVWVVMNESGAFVVDEDADAAADRAEEEFGEGEDVSVSTIKNYDVCS